MDQIIVRAYTPEDVAEVTALYNQRRVAAGTLQIPHTSEFERRERFAVSPTDRPIVAECDGRIVGHAALHIYGGRRKHVGSFGMGVDETYHGQGVGSRLMAELMDLADNWYNLRRVELTVYADNSAAIHLYEKFGFRIEGTHPLYAFREGVYVTAATMGRIRPEPPSDSQSGGMV